MIRNTTVFQITVRKNYDEPLDKILNIDVVVEYIKNEGCQTRVLFELNFHIKVIE